MTLTRTRARSRTSPRTTSRRRGRRRSAAPEHGLRRPRHQAWPLVSSRPLGRSLDPLPGESLNGFLLRLSCRLHVSAPPGWPAGDRHVCYRGLSRRLLLDLDTGSLPSSPGSPGPRQPGLPWFPGLTATRRSPGRFVPPGRRPQADDWLFTPETRYCPHCLAGDGSAVQDELGGCWKLAWHLPVVFACLGHRLPLQAGLHARSSRRGPWPHTADQAAGKQQPAPGPVPGSLCPARAAGGTSDSPAGSGSTSRAPNPLASPLKRSRSKGACSAMLDSSYPAEDAAAYFTDLRVATAILCITWPAARDFTRPADQALISQHVSELGAGTLPAIGRPCGEPAGCRRAADGGGGRSR